MYRKNAIQFCALQPADFLRECRVFQCFPKIQRFACGEKNWSLFVVCQYKKKFVVRQKASSEKGMREKERERERERGGGGGGGESVLVCSCCFFDIFTPAPRSEARSRRVGTGGEAGVPDELKSTRLALKLLLLLLLLLSTPPSSQGRLL